ncbi:hypothetical protein M5099_08925 [Neisseria meningitidis]|nr:hypothetical protein [Neisseria meningitidis]MCL5854989.1 hypothetical protein [Neisseria meningitidis]MCL5898926.1 hypothetical protein [Neisseria meningitidis]
MSAFFVRTRLNIRPIPSVCKGYFCSGGNYSGLTKTSTALPRLSSKRTIL